MGSQLNQRDFEVPCPFGKRARCRKDTLKREFNISEEWVSYELHPETLEEGVLLTERFPDYDFDELFEAMRIKGSRYGCEFGNVTLLVRVLPTFVFGETQKIVGMRSIEAIRALIRGLSFNPLEETF